MTNFHADTGSIGLVPSIVKGFRQISDTNLKSVERSDTDKYEIKPVEEAVIYLGRLIDRYLDVAASRGRADQTITSYGYKLRQFAGYVARRHFRTYDEAVFDFMKHAYQTAKSKNTAASLGRNIKAFSNWMFKERILAARPYIAVETIEVAPKSHDITEVAAAMRMMDAHTRFLCGFLLDSGCRIGEARKLRYGDYDVAAHCFSLSRTKSKRIRVISISPETEQELLYYRGMLPSDQRIFPENAPTYRRRFYKACARAGVPRFCPHRLRHTAAYEWLENGGSIHDLQLLLGHATPYMSLLYARARDKQLVEKVRRIAPISRLCKSIGPLFERQEG